MALLALALPARACEIPADFPSRNGIAGVGYVLAWRAVPAKIEVGRHFAVEAVVCPKAGRPAVTALGVDAEMPEHRHGMNYRARVAAKGEGRYLAEGLMFHMPGRWRFLFDVEAGSARERLAQDVAVE
ncbi:MAG: hypothetical protein N2544_10845 [Burkholderiales bacterium]|nr:hypothetical protein [Burkholderiales bacterium]